jgi:hypothetical protein
VALKEHQDRHHRAVDQHRRIIGLRGVEGRGAAVFLAEVGDEFSVGLVRQIGYPMLRARDAEGEVLQMRQ